MDWVGFPGLGIGRIFLPDYAFKVFNLEIRFYALVFSLAILLGFLCSYILAEKFGVLKSQLFDVLFFGLFFGIIGARFYYVIFNLSEYFNRDSIWLNLVELVNLRAGGLALYGGLIFSFVSGFFVCKIKNIKILPMADLASMGFLVGQSVGRWGNFFNVEAYGSTTSLPWGMVSNRIPYDLQPVHPVFFYESVWCGLIFLFLLFIFKIRKFDGEICGLYLSLYSLERFFVEGLRTDSLMFFQSSIRVSQLLSLIFFVCSVSCLIFFSFKFKGWQVTLFVETEEFENMLKSQSK